MINFLLLILAVALIVLFIQLRRHRKSWQLVLRELDFVYPKGRRSELDTLLDQISRWRTKVQGAQAMIERDARTLELIMENLPEAAFNIDEKLDILLLNQKAKLLFPDAKAGRNALNIFFDHRILEIINETLATEKSIARDFSITQRRDSHHSTHYLSFRALPLRNRAGNLHLLLLIVDETQARLIDQTRRDFVANASHELKTPLSIIRGYLDTLLEDGIDDVEQTERFLLAMQKNTQRILLLIDDLLTLSKLENTETNPLQVEEVDLQNCAQKAIEQLEPLFEGRVHLHLHFPNPVPTIQGDPFYWDQIFYNFLDNAIKENPHGELHIEIKLTETTHQIEITFSDDGVGIARDDLPHIFRRFYRGAKHRSQGVKGSGLGLSIVKHAVDCHGGSLSVASTPGFKTTFTITLPRP